MIPCPLRWPLTADCGVAVSMTTINLPGSQWPDERDSEEKLNKNLDLLEKAGLCHDRFQSCLRRGAPFRTAFSSFQPISPALI